MDRTQTKQTPVAANACPVSGLPVTRRPEWTAIDLGNGYSTTFEFIGNRLLLSRSEGWKYANRQTIKRHFEERCKVLGQMLAPNEPFVELRDYSRFNGISSKESRTQFIAEMEKDKSRILAFIGFNAPRAVKIGFNVWKRLFRSPFPVSIVKNYRTALEKALIAVNHPGGTHGQHGLKVLKFPQHTLDSGHFWVAYEIIDNRILHTRARGSFQTTDVAPAVDRLRRVSRQIETSGVPCYYVNGVTGVSLSTRAARLKYLNAIKQWHSDFPHFAMIIFYGANRWIKAAIHLLKHLLPVKIKIVDDLESALAYIKMRDASGRKTLSPENQHAPAAAPGKAPPYPGTAHTILEFLGNISWDTGKPGLPELPENADASFRPVYDAIALIKMDLDELEEGRRRSENERLILATAIEQSTDSISITDDTGKLLYLNPAFTAITGYSQAEALGRHIAFIASNRADTEILEALWQEVAPGRPVTRQITCNRKDGTPYIADTTISQIVGNNGNTRNFVTVQRNVTHEVQLEAQLKQIHKMEAIGTLAGGIAHDFNNILFPIIGYTEMSLDEVGPDSLLAQNLKEVLQAANRAKQLVKQILTFSKQDSTTRRQIKLVPVIKEALSLLRASIPSTIEIKQTYQKEVGLALADPTQIHQVIINLGSNAFHAMRETGGVMTISLQRFTAADIPAKGAPALPPGDYLKLSVSDSGHGISPEISERIFDPFFTTKEMATNTGMGLSMIHGIVTGHDGRIMVSSKPGQGTTFDVYLPEIKLDPALACNLPKKKAGALPEGQGRVLVVDDEKQSVKIIHKILESLGYQAISFTDSQSAIDHFRKNFAGIDLVITDQVMPKLTGDALAVEMVKIKPEIPVIVCTGHREMLNNIDTTQIREILSKPVSRKDLARAAQRVLSDTAGP